MREMNTKNYTSGRFKKTKYCNFYISKKSLSIKLQNINICKGSINSPLNDLPYKAVFKVPQGEAFKTEKLNKHLIST